MIQLLLQKQKQIKENIFLQKAGGRRVADIGEIREYNGVKHQKTASGWVPVSEGKEKKKPEAKQPPKTPKREENKPSNPKTETSSLSKHDRAQLTHLKSALDSDMGRASQIYSSLSNEAKEMIPQSVVDKIVGTNNQTSTPPEVVQQFEGFSQMMNIGTDGDFQFNDMLADGWLNSMKGEFENLSDDERISVNTYAFRGYSNINNCLRDPDFEPSTRNREEIQEDIDNISKVIQSTSGIKQNAVTYRGIDMSNPSVAEFFNSLEVGSVYEDAAFTSTSLNKNVASKNFRKNLDATRGLTIKVLIPKGTKVLPMNSIEASDIDKKEYEILLDKATKYEVVSRESGEMTVIVR